MSTTETTDVGGIARERLKQFVERWECLQEEVDGLKSDQKDIMSEAKSVGFEPKVIRQILRRRKMDRKDRREHDSLLELYESALGME